MTVIFDCPLAFECNHAAKRWLASSNPLIQDFGARLMSILHKHDIPIGRTENAPPEGLLADEFRSYPWQISTLKTQADRAEEGPLRQFYAYEKAEENFGLRLGLYWASPEWHYPVHEHTSFELHHVIEGSCRLFTKKQTQGVKEIPTTQQGDFYVHLPHYHLGLQSLHEPCLAIWAERTLEVIEVPRTLKDLYEMHADLVTSQLKSAAHSWLQSSDFLAQEFGRKLLPWIKPRRPGMEMAVALNGIRPPAVVKVGVNAPPEGMIPWEFRTCPWFPSGAYLLCKDPEQAKKMKFMKDAYLYRTKGAMFGLFYIPAGIYYGAHVHEPAEIYHVLDGEADFFLTEAPEDPHEDVTPKSETLVSSGEPGSFWLHHPYQAHGLQTFNKPLLILWGWIGDLQNFDFYYLQEDPFQSAVTGMAKL